MVIQNTNQARRKNKGIFGFCAQHRMLINQVLFLNLTKNEHLLQTKNEVDTKKGKT